jgi:hypothetical protein
MKEVSKKIKSLIIGSLLGDGYLSKERNRGNYLEIQHLDSQKRYLIWKRERFIEEGLTPSKLYFLTKYNGFKFQVYGGKFNGILLRHQLYPNNNKTITRHHLNWLDEEGLAIWFMDDGGKVLTKRNGNICGRYLKISSYNFTYDEHVIMKNYFETVWNIFPSIKMDKGKYYWLKFSATEAKKLISIIKPYIHEDLLYKIDLQYKETLCSNEQATEPKYCNQNPCICGNGCDYPGA